MLTNILAIIFLQTSWTVIKSSPVVMRAEAEYRKQEFLDVHNYLRRSVFPSASNMLKLEWDDQLAAIALENSQKCQTEHTSHARTYENLYAGGTNNVSVIVMYYFMERDLFDYNNRSKCPFEKCGHYEIMSDADMKYMGCAVTKSKCEVHNFYHSFCEYRKFRRDSWSSNIYAAGRPCSACPPSHPYCDNGLCVASKEHGTCEVECQNCGFFYEPLCICSCSFDYLKAPDCSVYAKSAANEPSCNSCSLSPSRHLRCLNGGQSLPSNCSHCNCITGFSGDRCQYNNAEINTGVRLTFHWSANYFGSWYSYYPMNIDQGDSILNIIRNDIVTQIKKSCSETILPSDISIAQGYPRITMKGTLQMVVLVKASACSSSFKRKNGELMPKDDLLKVLTAIKKDISAASRKSNGTPLLRID